MLVLIFVSKVMSHASVELFALQKPGLNYLNFIVLLSRRRLDAVLHLKVANVDREVHNTEIQPAQEKTNH